MESEFKGTKGEWLWEENSASDPHGSTCIEVSTNGPQIAYLQSFSGWEEDYGREVTIANANLISAAPELLDACQWLLMALRDGTSMDVEIGKEKAESAIEKALGK